MELFPAIYLRSGKAVRLFQGDYDRMTVYSDSPAEVAASFKSAGAKYLHLVDLDGAKGGDNPNFEVIGRIVSESGLLAEVGGGIRDMRAVEKYLSLGVMRVIIGTAAVTDPDFLREALTLYGDKIAVGVDIRDGNVATHGWTKASGLDCFDFCAQLQDAGVKTVICTDISKDGAMKGPNTQLYKELSSRFSMSIIASGGVTQLSDLSSLKEAGASGAILGKSLYTGSIRLEDAIRLMEGSL